MLVLLRRDDTTALAVVLPSGRTPASIAWAVRQTLSLQPHDPILARCPEIMFPDGMQAWHYIRRPWKDSLTLPSEPDSREYSAKNRGRISPGVCFCVRTQEGWSSATTVTYPVLGMPEARSRSSTLSLSMSSTPSSCVGYFRLSCSIAEGKDTAA